MVNSKHYNLTLYSHVFISESKFQLTNMTCARLISIRQEYYFILNFDFSKNIALIHSILFILYFCTWQNDFFNHFCHYHCLKFIVFITIVLGNKAFFVRERTLFLTRNSFYQFLNRQKRKQKQKKTKTKRK